MRKMPIQIAEIQRVVFQEDGQVHNRKVAVDIQNAPQVQERREEPHVVQPPMLRQPI